MELFTVMSSLTSRFYSTKCLSSQQPFALQPRSQGRSSLPPERPWKGVCFNFTNSPKLPQICFRFYKLFIENSFFIFALKDGKSGHRFIHDRALKGNELGTWLTSQIALRILHRCFQRTTGIPLEQSVISTRYETHSSNLCAVVYHITVLDFFPLFGSR